MCEMDTATYIATASPCIIDLEGGIDVILAVSVMAARWIWW